MSDFNEFICFTRGRDYGDGNFSGKKSVISADERKDFLREYASMLEKTYSLPEVADKVVTDKETAEVLARLDLRDRRNADFYIPLEDMRIYTKPSVSPYSGWHFYSSVRFCGGELVFEDGKLPPVPCAKYSFGKSPLREFEFEIYVDKGFAGTLRTKPLDTSMAARFVELRSDGKTVVKLAVYCNGTMCVLDASESQYHMPRTVVAENVLGKKINVKLAFGGSLYTLYIGGVKKGDFPVPTGEIPNNLFLSGGMHPRAFWRFKPVRLEMQDFTVTEFFAAQTDRSEPAEYIGRQSAPVALGTYKNRDKILIAEKDFYVADGMRAVLISDGLDPCGNIYVNGTKVADINGFMPSETDITDFVHSGENTLMITVFPRAPEVLYPWHRHADPYNAWVLRGGCIELRPENFVGGIKVVTNSVANGRVGFSVTADLRLQSGMRVEVSAADVSGSGGEVPLGSFGSDDVKGGVLKADFDCAELKVWSPETPALYNLTVRITDGDLLVHERSVETGFRTIEQKNGEILLNGAKVILSGALLMQFLPPYSEIPINHVCPSEEQIVWQLLMIKKLNGNTARMHQLGYGTNDERFCRIADRLGIMLIWTTRLIDTAESVLFDGTWAQGGEYASLVKKLINRPSIIMWEGSNEFHADLKLVDAMYDVFIDEVGAADKTRLLCPCSHLYYGGGIYDSLACEYYSDDGSRNQDGLPAESSYGWKDGKAVRSAHTYEILLGYGGDWEDMRTQSWILQKELLESRSHAYLVTEFAVIGSQDPVTAEKEKFTAARSYECGDEYLSLGTVLSEKEWKLSQAHQALCALHTGKKMRYLGADGLFWCCLTGGANDASYLKPVIDFFGYPKLGFYTLKDVYARTFAALHGNATHFGGDKLRLGIDLIGAQPNAEYDVKVTVTDSRGNGVSDYTFARVRPKSENAFLGSLEISVPDGYYRVRLSTQKVSE